MQDHFVDVEIDLGLPELEQKIQELIALHTQLKNKANEIAGWGPDKKVKVTVK